MDDLHENEPAFSGKIISSSSVGWSVFGAIVLLYVLTTAALPVLAAFALIKYLLE